MKDGSTKKKRVQYIRLQGMIKKYKRKHRLNLIFTCSDSNKVKSEIKEQL